MTDPEEDLWERLIAVTDYFTVHEYEMPRKRVAHLLMDLRDELILTEMDEEEEYEDDEDDEDVWAVEYDEDEDED
jgi:hypothetical protein